MALTCAAAVCGTALIGAGPSASAAGRGDWRPYRTQPFTDTGVCAFTVRGDIVEDQEEVRTLQTYPDGKVKLEEFRGPLVIRFSGNGHSVVREVSGYGWFHHLKDGTRRARIDGGLSIGVMQGNIGYPAGEYIIHGKFSVVFRADGNQTVHAAHAKIENLCQTLA
ncbi:hypothetical protein DZF91_31375 [Actinomadura logoneensis]|uniref:Allene oxide cyclase barrel-like domain-containing protein n=1 Tax=Actinomadura logoneensis TaxID=2293572 RepID=A0A372JCN3_9ACTN|nr:hypothetical protein [Actinomadura logoneensis]RFU37720.1 hypothetical protein DZF91_31375 [Actinomadura logoneensis]